MASTTRIFSTIVLGMALGAVANAADTWHVDAEAAAGGDGSQTAPFTTIQAAADLAQPGDTVLIHEGVYRESVRPARSGTATDPITYRAADGADVTLSGTDRLEGGWTASPVGAGIYQRPISDGFASRLNQAEQLLVDGHMMIRARWPDPPFEGLSPYQTSERSIDGYEDAKVSPDRTDWTRLRLLDAGFDLLADSVTGATIYLTPRHGNGDHGGGWGFTQSGVVISHSEGELVIDLPLTNLAHIDQFHMLDGGEPYHLEGVLGLLDTPGEWLRVGDLLYLMPPEGVDLATAQVGIKRRDYAFDCTERSYIHIRDLDVVAATITTDHDSGNYGAGGPRTTHRGRKDLAPSEGIVLERIGFRYVNHFTDFTAWDQGQWVQTSGVVVSGRKHLMRDCVIEYAAGNGILVIGDDHLIDNNIVANTNYTGCFAAGICSGMESINHDSRITRNTVYNAGFDGITSQKLRSNDRNAPARVDHNLVSNFGLLCRDVGGVKAVGHDDQTNGTRWDHNHVRDGGAWSMGIYQDYATGFVSDHNVVWDVQTGSNLNDAVGHRVYNNTYLGYRDGINGVGKLTDTEIINNIVSNSLDINESIASTVASNITMADGELFVDAAHGDFRLAEGSPARNAGQPVAGVTPNGDADPDCGAYQHTVDTWTAGSTLPLPIAAPTSLTARRGEDRGIDLHWTDHSGGERRQIVERCTRMSADSFWRHFRVVADLPPGTTAWTDDSPEARFHRPIYRVRAEDSLLSNTTGPQPINLVFHLDFEGDFTDSSGVVGTTATAPAGQDAPAFVVNAQRGAQAVHFDKDDGQMLQHADHMALNPGDGLTIMMWMRPDYWPGGNRVVLRKGPSEAPTFSLAIHSSSLRFQVGQWNSASFAPPPEGSWSHVALTYDGQAMRAYVDGVEVAFTERTHRVFDGIPITAEPLTIGSPGAEASAASRYDGLLDDLRIYNGPALTAEQIQAAYEGSLVQGPPLPPPDGNAAPVITAVTADPNPVTGTTTTLSVTAEDADGDSLSYSWSLDAKPSGQPVPTISGSGASVTVAFGGSGTYRFRVRASDGSTSDSATVDVAVQATATGITVTAP